MYRPEGIYCSSLAGKNALLCKMCRVCAVCVLLTRTKRHYSLWRTLRWLLYLAMSGQSVELCSDRRRPRGGVPCLKKSRNQFRLYTATASRARNEPS